MQEKRRRPVRVLEKVFEEAGQKFQSIQNIVLKKQGVKPAYLLTIQEMVFVFLIRIIKRA